MGWASTTAGPEEEKTIFILSPYDHVKLTVGFDTQVEEDGYK